MRISCHVYDARKYYETVDNETQYVYPEWTEAELKIINEHREYNYAMIFFIEDLEKEGPREVRLPKNLRHL